MDGGSKEIALWFFFWSIGIFVRQGHFGVFFLTAFIPGESVCFLVFFTHRGFGEGEYIAVVLLSKASGVNSFLFTAPLFFLVCWRRMISATTFIAK